jgi:hypothetical protein
VKTIRTDSENVFRSVKSAVNAQGVQLQFAAPGTHEKRIEIQIRYIRNRFDVVKASLGFTLPMFLYPYLLCDIASTLNMFPNANSPSICPYTMVTGKKLSMKSDLRHQFGEVVIVDDTPHKSSSSSGEKGTRGVVALVIGKDRDVQGGIRVYIPSRHVVVVRRHAKQGSLSADLVDLLNRKALTLRRGDDDERVVMLNGRAILPQLLTEDTIPRGMTLSLPPSFKGW